MDDPLRENLEEIRSVWLKQCGPCDFGLHEMSCACPPGDADYRPVMARLVCEVERLRAELAEKA